MKNLLHLIVALLLLITLSASVFGSQEAYASPQSAPQVRWEAAVRLRPEVIPLVAEEQRALLDSLSKSGVSARADGDWALLQGQKDLAQLNATLFDAAASWLDFFGGPVELTISLPSNGGPLTLNLEARNTTGYVWEVLPETVDYLQSGNEFAMRYFALGAPAIQTDGWRKFARSICALFRSGCARYSDHSIDCHTDWHDLPAPALPSPL